MSGIVGFTGDIPNRRAVIKQMSAKIAHRGPDGEGVYLAPNIAFGHRRLVLDNTEVEQPFKLPTGNLVIVFDGEIYNRLKLRHQLEKHKYRFQTKSDAELLLYGYQQWGFQLPRKLRGMFAFAIYDLKKKELFLARDHFGIKPLYYMKRAGTLMFASEIKSLLVHPNFIKKLNEKLIGPYLSFSFVPTEETLFKGVYRLEPGSSLLYQSGKIFKRQYFKLDFKPAHYDLEEAVTKITRAMTNSVQVHLPSNQKFGIFLSSGIDSSYLVCLTRPWKTYTVGYRQREYQEYNEINYAKALTSMLHLNNQAQIITKDAYLNATSEVMYYLDEPTGDPAAIALYFAAALVEDDVKVVLSGEGADEFFGGYNTYREEFDYSFYNKLPFWFRHLIAKLVWCLPEVRGVNFLLRRGQKLEEYYIGVNRVFSERESNQVLQKPRLISNSEIVAPLYHQFKGASNLIKMQSIDLRFWLSKNILPNADRMTMAHSLEIRVPFIDKKVFEIAKSLPFEYKVSQETTKVALRLAAHNVIPNEAYKKKKLGFPVPLREWLKEPDFYNEVKQAFLTPSAAKFIKPKYMIKLLEQHQSGYRDNYRKIWTVFCFLKWYEIYFVNFKT